MSGHYQLQTFEAMYAYPKLKKVNKSYVQFLQNLFKHIFKFLHYKKQANDLDNFQHIIYNMFGVESARPVSTEDVIIGPEAQHPRVAGAPPRGHLGSVSDVG